MRNGQTFRRLVLLLDLSNACCSGPRRHERSPAPLQPAPAISVDTRTGRVEPPEPLPVTSHTEARHVRQGCPDTGTPETDGIPLSGTMGRNCQYQPECKTKGLCAGEPGSCFRATAHDCKKSFACDFEGLCQESGALCVAKSDDDCANAVVCFESGQCSAQDGRCVATSQQNCQESHQCELSGLCTPRNGQCMAADSTDCLDSGACKVLGRCHAVDGVCLALCIADCSEPCVRAGLCRLRNCQCEAVSEDDCRNSNDCRLDGLCRLVGNQCWY